MLRERLGTVLFFLEERNPDASQFVGYVEETIHDVDDVLQENDFERCGFGQWRRTEGDKQLHVVAYPGTEFSEGDAMDTYLFAHWEPRHDVHPIAFARGNQRNVSKGVNEMRRVLQLESIPWENDPNIQ